MRCPRCDLPLSTGAPSWCKECNGCWAGVAELNSGPHAHTGAWTARDKGKLDCPVCHAAMEEVLHGPTNTVVDRCKDHGVWFDVDEMREVHGGARVSLTALGAAGGATHPERKNSDGVEVASVVGESVVVVGEAASAIGEGFLWVLSSLGEVLDV